MSNQSKTVVILSRIKPKYKDSAYGVYIIKNGVLYFSSGKKNLVRIKEHFPTIGATAENLIENTVRYEAQNSADILEKRDNPCYNDKVNDVL